MNIAERLASMLIGQDPETNEIISQDDVMMEEPRLMKSAEEPRLNIASQDRNGKADDAINFEIFKNRLKNNEQDALNIVLEGIMTGGIGGALRLGSKAGSSIIKKILERNARSAKNLKGLENIQRPADKGYLLEETAKFNKMMKELGKMPESKPAMKANNSLLKRLLPLSLLGISGDSE